MNADEKEILRLHFQNQKADAELMLEMLEKGSPSEQPRESAKTEAKPEYKVEMPDLSKLAWVTVQAPNNPKGPWEKTIDASKPEFSEMMKILKSIGKSLFSGGYLYWTGMFLDVEYIGRRLQKK